MCIDLVSQSGFHRPSFDRKLLILQRLEGSKVQLCAPLNENPITRVQQLTKLFDPFKA